MPKSKVRKKDSHTPAPDRHTPVKAQALGPSHPIYLAVMFGMMLLGLLWLIVYYLAGDKIPPMQEIGGWNFGVGFAFIIVGLLMTMRWR